MPISDRIVESINKYNSDELENSLIQLCVALDATSKDEYPHIKKVGRRFQSFVKANHDIITFFTLGGNAAIDCRFGKYTVEEFIYQVLRCGLIHEGELSRMVEFVEPGRPVSIGGSKWSLPKTFIFGTLLATIGAASNINQSAPSDLMVEIMGHQFKLNDLWGRSDLVRQAIFGEAA